MPVYFEIAGRPMDYLYIYISLRAPFDVQIVGELTENRSNADYLYKKSLFYCQCNVQIVAVHLILRSDYSTSQLPVSKWHAYFNEPAIADAFIDRFCANAHRIEINGESLRRKKHNIAEHKATTSEVVHLNPSQTVHLTTLQAVHSMCY